MQEKLISFETAKLAKEKDFPQNISQSFFNNNGQFYPYPCHWVTITEGGLFSAPTQSLLQKWLREVHNIDVNVYVMDPKGNWQVRVTNIILGATRLNYEPCIDYKTYEDALEEGLSFSLNQLSI